MARHTGHMHVPYMYQATCMYMSRVLLGRGGGGDVGLAILGGTPTTYFTQCLSKTCVQLLKKVNIITVLEKCSVSTVMASELASQPT